MELMDGITIEGSLRISLRALTQLRVDGDGLVIPLGKAPAAAAQPTAPTGRNERGKTKGGQRGVRYYCSKCDLCNDSGRPWKCNNPDSPKYEKEVGKVSGCQQFVPTEPEP
jgi:hypothetical protein